MWGARTRLIGQRAETFALVYLLLRGLRLVERNYTVRGGEIDLVMIDRRALSVVFVEVRYRHSVRFGTPAASVGPDKQRRITLAAQTFMVRHSKYACFAMRFDVVSMWKPNYLPHIVWIRDAFQP